MPSVLQKEDQDVDMEGLDDHTNIKLRTCYCWKVKYPHFSFPTSPFNMDPVENL